jgi:hypothetical protein
VAAGARGEGAGLIVTLCGRLLPTYDRSVKILYLDESGDHSLSVIDSQYPVFVLGGVVVDAVYAEADMDAAVRRLKIEVFGRSDITLHTADIIRQRGPFASLIDPGRRRLFHDRLNALMQQLDYTVVACAIRKDAHLAAYGAAALDPYALSLNVLVERFCFALADTGETQPGVITAECRDRTLDSALMASWHHLRERGTAYLRPQEIRDRVAHLRLERKQVGGVGLELADLVVSPIGRFVTGRPPREDWTIVESKLRRRRGDYLGAGLVILPKE